MTIKEAIERLRTRICNEGSNRPDHTYHFCRDDCMYGEDQCEIALAIKALKAIDEMGDVELRILALQNMEKELKEIMSERIAHWERPNPNQPKSYTRICSRCKGTAYVIGGAEYPRCPWCGALMRKENEE